MGRTIDPDSVIGGKPYHVLNIQALGLLLEPPPPIRPPVQVDAHNGRESLVEP